MAAWGIARAAGHSLLGADVRASLAAGASRVGVVGDKGDHGNLPGPLNRRPQGALVFGADTGAAARLNLGPLGNEPSDLVDIFVVDVRHVLYAEGANFAPTDKAPTGASTRSTRSSARAAWTASTTAATSIPGWWSALCSWGFSGHSSSIPFGLAAPINTGLKRQIIYRFEIWSLVGHSAGAHLVGG